MKIRQFGTWQLIARATASLPLCLSIRTQEIYDWSKRLLPLLALELVLKLEPMTKLDSRAIGKSIRPSVVNVQFVDRRAHLSMTFRLSFRAASTF